MQGKDSYIQGIKKMREIRYTPVGIVHSPFKNVKGMPIQTVGARGVEGYSLQVKPFMDDKVRGVFATRAPKRPNPIGISVVRFVKIQCCTLFIEDVDVVDGTPLLDIKPFVPEFDVRKVERTGWLSKKAGKVHRVRADQRFRHNG